MRRIALLAVLGLALTGCAADAPDATPTVTSTLDANVSACSDFEGVLQLLHNNVTAGANGDADAWHERLKQRVDSLDEISLRADGDVKDRMSTLVDNLPSGSAVTRIGLKGTPEAEQFAADVERLGNACDAAGYNWKISIKTD